MLVADRIKQASRVTIGTKQTKKAIEKKEAKVVFMARDAERRVIEPLIKLCYENGIEVIEVPSMLELGLACGIEVGSASAAIID